MNQTQKKLIEQEMRLQVRGDFGVLDFVPCRRQAGEPYRWAWPGGGAAATYGEIVRLCRQRGWPRPELMPARVVRRAELEGEE